KSLPTLLLASTVAVQLTVSMKFWRLKLIFTLKRGLNLEEGTPNYDIKQLALECATKRMYPDVLSYDKIVDLTGSFKVPMGCRSFLQGWKDENGVEVNSGRMNLGVVTVNLPRIALE
ncbi:anaerobic ribonucleoside-triphosphate reductase, partial [Streptococcus pneumoniae]|uniref:anaerobic ribonucleoside-triphosphate reductase n=1 Tax=Streptococcus pneumoniae TaxID=1313 RepID=UPI000A975E97